VNKWHGGANGGKNRVEKSEVRGEIPGDFQVATTSSGLGYLWGGEYSEKTVKGDMGS